MHFFISFSHSEKLAGTLKDQLASIQPQLDELRRKQDMRVQQFIDVKAHIDRITREILGSPQTDENGTTSPPSQEEDLSLKRLDEFHAQLHSLQKEKVIQFKYWSNKYAKMFGEEIFGYGFRV